MGHHNQRKQQIDSKGFLMFSLDNWLSVGDVFQEIYERLQVDADTNGASIEDTQAQAYKEFTDFLGFCDSAAALSPTGNLVRVRKYFLQQVWPDGTDHWFFSYETGLVRSLDRSNLTSRTVQQVGQRGYRRHFASLGFFYDRMLKYAHIPASFGGGIFGFLVSVQKFLDLNKARQIMEADESLFSREYMFWGSIEIAWLLVLSSGLVFLALIASRKTHSLKLDERAELYGFEGYSIVFPSETLARFLSLDDHIDTETKGSEASVAKQIVELFDRKAVFTRSDAQNSLGRHLSARGFGRAWDLARSARPEIGKPGRKGKFR
jgi:hypothetical protein